MVRQQFQALKLVMKQLDDQTLRTAGELRPTNDDWLISHAVDYRQICSIHSDTEKSCATDTDELSHRVFFKLDSL